MCEMYMHRLMAMLMEVVNLSKGRQEIVEAIRLQKEKEIGKLHCSVYIVYFYI